MCHHYLHWSPVQIIHPSPIKSTDSLELTCDCRSFMCQGVMSTIANYGLLILVTQPIVNKFWCILALWVFFSLQWHPSLCIGTTSSGEMVSTFFSNQTWFQHIILADADKVNISTNTWIPCVWFLCYVINGLVTSLHYAISCSQQGWIQKNHPY